MALRGADAVLDHGPGLAAPGDGFGRRRLVMGTGCVLPDDLAAGIDAQRSGLAVQFEDHEREGVGLGMARIGDLADAGAAADMAEQHRRMVLALDAGADLLRPAGDRLGLAHEDAGDVEDMDADIEDGEALDFGEIGLTGIDVVAGPEGEAAPDDLADRARIDQLGGAQQRRLEAEILMHHHRQAGAVERGDERACAGPVRRQRFLHDDRHPLGGAGLGEGEMRGGGGRDVDEIEGLVGEHLVDIGIGLGHAEAFRGRFRLGAIDIADRDDAAALAEIVPGIEMILREEPAADHGGATMGHGGGLRVSVRSRWIVGPRRRARSGSAGASGGRGYGCAGCRAARR